MSLTCVCMCVRAHMGVYVLHVCMCASPVYVCVCMHVCVCGGGGMYVGVCMCAHGCMHMCAHRCMHAQVHTHTPSPGDFQEERVPDTKFVRQPNTPGMEIPVTRPS